MRRFALTPALAVAALITAAPGASAETQTTWTPAVPYPGVAIETPTAVGIDARHTQTVLLGGTFGGVHGVYATNLAEGAGAWSAPVLLAQVDGKIAGLVLAVGPTGEAVATWHDGSRPTTTFVATRSASGAWSNAATAADVLGAPAGTTVTSPAFAVAPSGELWASWAERSDGAATATVRAARRAPGSSAWTPDEPISTTAPLVPRFDALGDAVAVFKQGEQLVATERRAGAASWEPAHALSSASTGIFVDGTPNYLGVAAWEWSVNADGDVAVAWVDSYGPPQQQVKVAQRPAGGQWSEATILADVRASEKGAFPGLAISQDRGGRATVVVHHNLPDVAETPATGAELLASAQGAGGQWPALAPVQLPESAAPQPTIQDFVDLAESGAGHAVVSWRTADGAAVAVRPPAGGFSFSAPPAVARAARPLAVSDAGVGVLGSGSRITISAGTSAGPRLIVPLSIALLTISRAACPNTVAVYVNGQKTGGLRPQVPFARRCLYQGNVPAPAGLRAGQTVLLTVTGINVFTGWGLGRVVLG